MLVAVSSVDSVPSASVKLPVPIEINHHSSTGQIKGFIETPKAEKSSVNPELEKPLSSNTPIDGGNISPEQSMPSPSSPGVHQGHDSAVADQVLVRPESTAGYDCGGGNLVKMIEEIKGFSQRLKMVEDKNNLLESKNEELQNKNNALEIRVHSLESKLKSLELDKEYSGESQTGPFVE